MGLDERLSEVEKVLNTEKYMSVADAAHWFWLMATERSAGGRELGEQGGYTYPGGVSLFSTNITPEDWEWYDANAERFVRWMEQQRGLK